MALVCFFNQEHLLFVVLNSISPDSNIKIYKLISVYILVIIQFLYHHLKLKSTPVYGLQPLANIKYETPFALMVSNFLYIITTSAVPDIFIPCF